MFLRLLFESFRRQKRRKALAGLAILLGTTAVTAMLALATTIGDRIHKELAVYGANIVVTPKASNLEVNVGGLNLKPATGNAYLHESDLAKLKTIFWHNNITAISPELSFTTQVSAPASGDSFIPVTVLGLWINHPFASGVTGADKLHPSWHLEGDWPASHQSQTEVALGSSLAKKLDVRVGDSFHFGKERDNVYKVSGIMFTGSEVDKDAFLPLSTAQAISNRPDAISRIEIAARTRPEDAFARRDPDTLAGKQKDLWYCRPYANSIAYQIREAIPNADAQQVRRVEQSEGAVLSRISGLMWLISAAALLAAAFAVSAAMATAVLERRIEIGLMRSLGAGKASVAALFLSESALLATGAGALGYLLGSLLAWRLGAHIFPAEGAGAPFNPVLLPVIVAMAVAVAIAGSLPSIRSALQANPSNVLRGNA